MAIVIKLKPEEYLLVTDLFDQYRQFYGQASDLNWAEQFIKERLDKNESVIFVAMEGQKPVGFIQLYPSFSSVRAVRDWILNDLFVDKNFRRSGIGKMLMEEAIRFATMDNSPCLMLETAKDNFSAQSLYKSLGFTLAEPDQKYLKYILPL